MAAPATSGLTIDLGEAYERLELERRLADAPERTTVRGLFFKLPEAALRRHAPGLLPIWRAACQPVSRWPFKLYPLKRMLVEQATAAALLDPADPADALRRIWLETPMQAPLINAQKYVTFLSGGDPARAFRWLTHNRHLFCNYGSWHLEEVSAQRVVFHIHDEYIWIDSAHRGGAEGSLALCGVSGVVTPDLDSRYNGRLIIDWS